MIVTVVFVIWVCEFNFTEINWPYILGLIKSLTSWLINSHQSWVPNDSIFIRFNCAVIFECVVWRRLLKWFFEGGIMGDL